MSSGSSRTAAVRYQPDESPPAALAFGCGLQLVILGGDHRKGLVAGIAFWVGAGCQNDMIFPGLLSNIAGGLLQNGITAGGLVAILLTLLLEMTAPRRSRIEVDFDLAVLPKILASWQRAWSQFCSANTNRLFPVPGCSSVVKRRLSRVLSDEPVLMATYWMPSTA